MRYKKARMIWKRIAFIGMMVTFGAGCPVKAQIAIEPWLAVGEITRANSHSVISKTYGQGGVVAAYDWAWLRANIEVGLSPAPLGWGLEGLVGMGLGHALGWFHPMLTLSTGYQGANHEEAVPDPSVIPPRCGNRRWPFCSPPQKYHGHAAWFSWRTTSTILGGMARPFGKSAKVDTPLAYSHRVSLAFSLGLMQ